MTARGRAAGWGLVFLVLALDVAATARLATLMGTANDLFPRWYGARAWLYQGLDPYAAAVSDGIRAAMGGAPGAPGGGESSAFVFGFVYPAYVLPLLVPLAALPFGAAATLWLLLAQAGICAGAWWCWRAALQERGEGGQAGAAGVGAPIVVGAAVLFPAALLNLVFGQFAALVFAALAGGWALLLRRRDAPAGVALALATIKPSVALLPVVALLAWSVARRRPGVWRAWLASMATLLVVSLAAVPGWPGAFIESTRRYALVAGATSAAGLAGQLPAGQALVAVGALALAWWGWRRSPRAAGDALAAGVLLGCWLVPPLYEWNSLLLLQPLAQVGASLTPRRRRLALAGLAGLSLATLPAIAAAPSLSRLLWPALALVAWAVQPARRLRPAGGDAYAGDQNVTRRAGTSPSFPVTT